MDHQDINKACLQAFKALIKLDPKTDTSRVQRFISTIYLFEQSRSSQEWYALNQPLFCIASKEKKVKFVCAKILEPLKDEKYLKAYHCIQCAEEDNSIVCGECFDQKKHKGHRYEILKIVGGCCDCGDSSMWKEQGFCDNHRKDKVKYIDIFREHKNEFFQLYTSVFHALCYLYEALECFIKKSSNNLAKQQKQQFITDMTEQIDRFGHYFMKNLVVVNKDRYNLNKMTKKWLRSDLVLPECLQFVKGNTIHQQYMQFTKLQKTAKTCVELFILLFNRGEIFKQQIAFAYYHLYSTVPGYLESIYSEFSPQLFASSLLLKKLYNKKKVQPAITTILLKQQLQGSQLQKQVKKFGDYFQKYYKDMKFLLSLNEIDSTNYWRCFQEKQKITKLATYPEAIAALKGQERTNFIKMVNKIAYYIEQKAMACILKIISKLIRFPDFIKQGIVECFDSIRESFQNQSDLNKQRQYMFFTEQRILSILLFAYLYKVQNVPSLSQVEQKHLAGLMDLVKLDKHQFRSDLQLLLKQILRYFVKISRAVSSDSSIQSNKNFAITYFKSANHPNLLFSIDAFLFKFIQHALEELPQLPDPRASFEKFIVQAINVELRQFKTQFNIAVSQYDRSRQQNLLKGVNGDKLTKSVKARFQEIEKVIICTHSCINLINESIFSELVELVLLSHVEQFLDGEKFNHHSKIKVFYERFLHTLKPHPNSSSYRQRGCLLFEFRDLVRYLFFQETTIFKKFVEQNQRNSPLSQEYLRQKLNACSQINLDWLYSLRFKLQNQKVKDHLPKRIFFQNPIVQTSKYGSYFFQKTIYLAFTKEILKALMEIKESQFNLINDVVKELVRMQYLTKDPQIHSFFKCEFLYLKVKPNLTDGKMLSIYSFLDEKIEKLLKVYRQNASHIRPEDDNDRQNQKSQISFQQIQQRMQEENNLTDDLLQTSQIDTEQLSCILPRECLFSKNTCQKETQLYWLCYAKETIMHEAFTINNKQKFLMFSTCGHLCHKECLQAYRGQKELDHCPKCSKAFNITISAHNILQDQLTMQQSQKLNQRILQQITLFLPSNERPPHHEIFRSIVIFIIQFLTHGDFNVFNDNVLLYRSLLTAIKLEFQMYNSQIQSLRKAINLNGSSVSEENKLISCVIELLQGTLFSNNKLKNQSKFIKKFQYLKDIVKLLQSNELKWTKPSLTEMITTTPIYKCSRKLLPQNLQDLSLKGNPAKCHNHSIEFFICLLPHPEDQTWQCLCQTCLKHNLVSHIRKYHFNESLLISSQSGKVQYYFLPGARREGKEMLHYEGSSVYHLMSTGQAFQAGRGLEKRECTLSEEKLKIVIKEFVCGRLTDRAEDKQQ